MGKRLIGSVGLAPGSDTGFDLDTKGQIHGYSSTQFALDVGTANQGLLVDSSATAGIKWGASATSVLSATGDILYASGANTLARLAKGDNDKVLTLKSGLPSWESSGGGASAWSSEGNDINTAKGATLDVTVTDQDVYQILYNVADGGDQSAPLLVMRLNDDDGATYDTLKQWGTNGANTESEVNTGKTKYLLSNGGGEDGYNGCAYVYKNDSNFASGSQGGATLISQTQQISSSAPLYVVNAMGTNTGITSAITKITLKVMNQNDEDDSQIIGSMRVNSMSYS